MTGALPSPPHKAFSVHAFRKTTPIPEAWGVIPPQLDIWGNSTWGDCVSAEEAAAKAQFSVMCGLPEVFIPADVLTSWARHHGYLNGAVITDVMDSMAKDGITANGVTYKDGPYMSVDWTKPDVLSAAIYQGPVKIGVVAGQLQRCVTGSNGWWGTGFHTNHITDHSVNLCGYGTADALADLMKTSKPSSLNGGTMCYMLFTWGTIGILDHSSMEAITGEAWERTPTTVGQVPVPPPVPVPVPIPMPVPVPPPGPAPVFPMSGTYQIGVYQVNWTASINDPAPPAGP